MALGQFCISCMVQCES